MGNLIHDYFKFTFNRRNSRVASAQSLIVNVPGGLIEYSRFGSGEPLFLIIGYGASMNGWDVSFLDELAQTNEVIIFNNRNIGRTFFEADNEYDVEDMAKDVELLRIALNFEKISLCAISLGGVIAQQYAYTYPDNLRKMTLINSLPPGNLIIEPNYNIQNLFKSTPSGNFATQWKMLNILFPSIWQAANLGLFYFKINSEKNTVSTKTLLEQQKVMEQWSKHNDPVQFLQSIKTPTQILIGKLDQLVPPLNSYVLQNYLVNSNLIEYKNGGHIMIYQEPFLLAHDISKFIN